MRARNPPAGHTQKDIQGLESALQSAEATVRAFQVEQLRLQLRTAVLLLAARVLEELCAHKSAHGGGTALEQAQLRHVRAALGAAGRGAGSLAQLEELFGRGFRRLGLEKRSLLRLEECVRRPAAAEPPPCTAGARASARTHARAAPLCAWRRVHACASVCAWAHALACVESG